MAAHANGSQSFVEAVREKYDIMLAMGDPRVKDWPLMDSPLFAFCYMIGYFLLAWVGPKLMEKRKPMDPGHVLTVYNLLLVALSFYMFYEFAAVWYLAGFTVGCQQVDYSHDPLAIRLANVCWVYFFSKFIEVADTIFFILRKKTSQISFLHVYHHGTMIFNWWMVVKFIAGGGTTFHALLNSFVHVVMYAYYGLSAFGPWIQPYLWWKKYVTKIQLIQFLVVMVHSTHAVFCCDFPIFFSVLAMFYAISMIALFSNFYYHSYWNKKPAHAATNGLKAPAAKANGHHPHRD